MAKGGKRGRRKEGDSSEQEEQSNDAKDDLQNDLGFAQRRELQRKVAAEKRRAKMKCHLCGEVGHVRRECPGIADGGSGSSKFTKKKGDPGAVALKGSKNRGQKPSSASCNQQTSSSIPALPLGFERRKEQEESAAGISVEGEDSTFLYYDASCDIAASIDYIRFGRGKHKLSNNEAVALYQSAVDTAIAESNYGGCISRSIIKPGRPWVNPSPFNNHTKEWFVVGLGRDFLLNDNHQEAALTSLLDTLAANDNIVGFFADLDCATDTLNRAGCDWQSQQQRLVCTCQAAAEANVVIQIRILPGASSSSSSNLDGDVSTGSYTKVVKDLTDILSTNVAKKYPMLKIHVSSWTGTAEDMLSLLQTFPENVWFGLDSTVTFAKACRVQECAFDVPLHRILLETGANSIPSIVTKSMGRHAFSSSALIPFIAQAIAEIKKVDAATVARAAATNTRKLYPTLMNVVSSHDTVPIAKDDS